MTIKIHCRTLLEIPTEELWHTLTGSLIIKFDSDEELEVDYRSILYSSYSWDLFREFPDTLILPKHILHSILKGKRLSSDTHLVLLGEVMWSVYDTYLPRKLKLGIDEIDFRDYLAKKVYQITNLMYNDLTYKLEAYVTSLDITDFIEVLNHPRIKEANKTVKPTQESIDSTYKEITDVIMSSTELPNNPLSLASRSKLVSLQQLLQCVGPRGYLTDTNSQLFKNPVLVGYATGMRKFHDSFIESRSAAKSLIFSKSPLQQAEYFSRRLQLMTENVQHLHPGDCGSTEYLIHRVRPPINIKGETKRPGDLKLLVGKYYLDEETNTLKIIGIDDTHLIGKTLKIRSVNHCMCPDPIGICSVCFGQLSLSVTEGSNIGQMCSTSLAQKSSQKVLSVKHLDGSSVVDGIILSQRDRLFLKVAEDDNSYCLADKLIGKNIILMFNPNEVNNLTDIMEVLDVGDLNITRVSEVTTIGIKNTDGDTITIEAIEVCIGQRLASISLELLRYIRINGWDIDEKGNYCINMKDWDFKKEILTLPLRHYNMSEHSAKQKLALLLEMIIENFSNCWNTLRALLTTASSNAKPWFENNKDWATSSEATRK